MKSKVRLSLDISPQLHFLWKILAAKENISIKDLIVREMPALELQSEDEIVKESFDKILVKFDSMFKSLANR